MGAIGGLLGTAGGAAGSGFAAPALADIQTPTTDLQANQTFDASQNALNGQQSFLNALQGQNGIGNQSSVYNQLQGVANGTGPNPAQAMLAQQTAANTANQASLMAGQRGAGANPALIARQAAMQGAANQQNAVGQAATMQANQSLGALNSLGQLANTQVAQQGQVQQGLVSGTQGEQSNILNAINGQNSAAVGNQAGVNAANSALAQTTMKGQQGLIGGLMNSAGAGTAGKAEGGLITAYAAGGAVGPTSTFGKFLKGAGQGLAQAGSDEDGVNPLFAGASALASRALHGKQSTPDTPVVDPATQQQAKPAAQPTQMAQTAPAPVATPDGGSIDPNEAGQIDNNETPAPLANGGKVPAMLSPGERYLSPKAVAQVKKGADPIKAGKKVPGEAKVKGAKNDYANDTIPATLEEGGIVLPRSVTESAHPHWAAHKFVSAIMAKNKGKLK